MSDKIEADSVRIYPCEKCGKLRTKDEGGTTFTFCDDCWDKYYGKFRKRKKLGKIK